ncbi:MAG: hypothetical protein ACPGSM_00050 [Thiolinea sp.]
MRLHLGRWKSLLNHLLWRLGIILPMIFTQYANDEEVYADRSLSGWKLGLVSVVVIGVSVWSFFI